MGVPTLVEVNSELSFHGEGMSTCRKRLDLIMRHLRATSDLELAPENRETIKLSYQHYASRTSLRHYSMFVCLLLASYLLGVVLTPLCKSQGLGTTAVQESSAGPLNNLKMVADDEYPPNQSCDLNFMDGKRVILVSHELSLSGGPLLLMELGNVLRRNGADVFWVTANKKETTSPGSAVLSLEKNMLNCGIQILAARGMKTVATLTKADLVILNTAVAGKWIESVLTADDAQKSVLNKTLWWIHEMRGHYFAMEYVKHLPEVAGIMVDSHSAADYWRARTRDRLRMILPKIYVVHLGNSHQLMLAAEDAVARASMRQHVRQMVGISEGDVVIAMINSFSRGKGQDLFLRAFLEGVNLVKQRNIVDEKIFTVHALLVGSDWAAPSYELLLRNFVKDNDLESTVHFVNKSLDIVAYLAASDVLVQNSQGRGECFGRITIEAMAFQLPILGTAAGGTLEIVVNGITGRLHPVGKAGVHVLAHNIRDLTCDKSLRIKMGSRGLDRVKQYFMEQHMCERLSPVLQSVLSKLLVQHHGNLVNVSLAF